MNWHFIITDESYSGGMTPMIELILVIAVWLVSYFFLPGIINLYSGDHEEETVNPVQKINFGTINAILFLLLTRWFKNWNQPQPNEKRLFGYEGIAEMYSPVITLTVFAVWWAPLLWSCQISTSSFLKIFYVAGKWWLDVEMA